MSTNIVHDYAAVGKFGNGSYCTFRLDAMSSRALAMACAGAHLMSRNHHGRRDVVSIELEPVGKPYRPGPGQTPIVKTSGGRR